MEAPQNIGLVSATAMGISLMLGSGIFTTPASVLKLSGSPAMALVLWALGAVVSFGGAVAFVELGLMIRGNGGTMRYLAHAYPRPKVMLAYLFAWSMVLCIRPGAIAANGPIIGRYWLYAAGIVDSGWRARAIGWACITGVTMLNILSARWALRVMNVLTAVKIIVLLVICAAGLAAASGAIPGAPLADGWKRGFSGTSTDAHSYASALTRVFWAYDGFSNLAYSLGELQRPEHTLPWAIGGAVGIVGVLYVLANVAFLLVVPIDVAMRAEETLAAEFTGRVLGSAAGQVALPVFIGLSVLGAVCAQTYGVARLLDTVGQVGFVPLGRWICGNHAKLGTPVYAIALVYVLTLVYLLAPPPGRVFDLLVDFVQWSTWLFYGLAAAGVIVLRYTQPVHPLRSFRAFPPLTILFVVCCLYLTVFPFVPPSKTEAAGQYPYYLSPLLGLLTTLLGLVPWYLRMVWWPRQTGVDMLTWLNLTSVQQSDDSTIEAENDAGVAEITEDGSEDIADEKHRFVLPSPHLHQDVGLPVYSNNCEKGLHHREDTGRTESD